MLSRRARETQSDSVERETPRDMRSDEIHRLGEIKKERQSSRRERETRRVSIKRETPRETHSDSSSRRARETRNDSVEREIEMNATLSMGDTCLIRAVFCSTLLRNVSSIKS